MVRGPEIPVQISLLSGDSFYRKNTMRRERNVDTDPSPLPGGTVTGIVALARPAGRFSVIVDGKAAHTLVLTAIERLGLAVGGTTIAREEAIAREERSLRTYDRAIRMLAARGRAAKDLERQLIRKGEPPEFARLAVERLESERLVDDEAYARNFVRSKTSGAGLARYRLKQELGQQGVDQCIADEAVREVFEEESIDEVASATALATKRARSLHDEDPVARRRRVYAFLARRGYPPSVISTAMDAVFHAKEEGLVDAAPE